MTPYYEHGGIALYHGDCREMMPTEPVALVSDPPYGIALSNHDQRGLTRRKGTWKVAGDSDGQIGMFLIEWAAQRNLMIALFASPWAPWPGLWRNLIVWDKGGAVGGGGDTVKCLKRTWELIQVNRNARLTYRDVSVWKYPVRKDEFAHHPTQKPLPLLCRLVGLMTRTTDVVFDPCAGSGTTLLAAKSLGRRAIGIEAEERYCETAARRLEQEVLPLEASA